jgi:succinate--hydroxymethylglutarate CoA-transferase
MIKDGAPSKPGVAVTDLLTGLYAKGAILTALLQREDTGKGQYIDVNLINTQVVVMLNIRIILSYATL